MLLERSSVEHTQLFYFIEFMSQRYVLTNYHKTTWYKDIICTISYLKVIKNKNVAIRCLQTPLYFIISAKICSFKSANFPIGQRCKTGTKPPVFNFLCKLFNLRR